MTAGSDLLFPTSPLHLTPPSCGPSVLRPPHARQTGTAADFTQSLGQRSGITVIALESTHRRNFPKNPSTIPPQKISHHSFPKSQRMLSPPASLFCGPLRLDSTFLQNTLSCAQHAPPPHSSIPIRVPPSIILQPRCIAGGGGGGGGCPWPWNDTAQCFLGNTFPLSTPTTAPPQPRNLPQIIPVPTFCFPLLCGHGALLAHIPAAAAENDPLKISQPQTNTRDKCCMSLLTREHTLRYREWPNS